MQHIGDYSPSRLSNSLQGPALNHGRLLIMLSWYINAKKRQLYGVFPPELNIAYLVFLAALSLENVVGTGGL